MTRLERCIGYSCGLAMLGLKASCLICLKHAIYKNLLQQIAEVANKLSIIGITVKILSDDGNRVLVIVYRQAVLAHSIMQFDAITFLSKYGYTSNMAVEDMVQYLALRINKTDEFPHEVGVFLGYPICDIVGFIENPQGHKLSGIWKVYDNVDECKKIFWLYDIQKKAIQNKIQAGEDLFTIFSYAV